MTTTIIDTKAVRAALKDAGHDPKAYTATAIRSTISIAKCFGHGHDMPWIIDMLTSCPI